MLTNDRRSANMRPMTESLLLRELRDRRNLPSPARRRAIRVDAGTSQAAIAAEIQRRAGIGCTAEAIGNYEAGRRTPRGLLLQTYAEILRDLESELRGGPDAA